MQSPPKGRILIVDDDRRVAAGLQEHLTKYLLYVRVASSVAEAFSEIAHDRFDVIVLDWVLQDGDGREIIEEIRRYFAETVVIVYSAHSTSDAECSALRADQFVLKSYDTTAIRNAVQRGLSQLGGKRLRSSSYRSRTRDRFWELVHEAISATGIGEFVVRGPDSRMAAAYSEWLLSESQHFSPVFYVDSGRNTIEPITSTELMGDVQSDRGGQFLRSRGLLDQSSAVHLHFAHAQFLPAEVITELADVLSTGCFCRSGSSRDIECRATLSFSTGISNISTRSAVEQLERISQLRSILFPESPLEIRSLEDWIRCLNGDVKAVRGVSGLARTFERLSPAACWRALRQMADSIAGSIFSTTECGNWFNEIPLFESLLNGESSEPVVTWKSVSDVPKRVYVAWLLAKTGDNIAEASRLSGMTRASIYAAIAGS